MPLALPESIRGRLVALMLAVALPLFGVLLWGFWEEVSREHRDARDLALRIARSTAADLRGAAARSQELLARMSERPKIVHPDSLDCDSLFGIVDFFPQYLNVLLYDASGRPICSATPNSADAPFAAAAEDLAGARIREGNPGSLVVSAGRRWVLVLFRRVGNGTLALEQYFDLDVDAYPRGTTITVANARGEILARAPEGAHWVGQNISHLGRAVLRGREGRFEGEGLDGVSRHYGFTRLDNGWTVFVGVPTGVAMASVRALVLRGVVAGLIIMAVVFVFALRIAGSIERPLGVLARAVQRVGDHGYSGHVPVEGPREVAVVAEEFNRTIDSRSEFEQALVESRAQLEALSTKLLEVQEDERSRIVREIHDEMGQLLTALNMDIGGLLKSAEPLTEDQKTMAHRIRRALTETLASVQRIASELRPAALDDFGLVAAIEAEVQKFEQRSGVECELSVPQETFSLGPAIDAAIYRIVQEGMTNVARHSDATRLEIRLRHRPGELLVEIRDDGRGIPAEKIHDRSSLGIAGMRERARRIGGTLEVEGVEGRGTIVSVRVPLEAA